MHLHPSSTDGPFISIKSTIWPRRKLLHAPNSYESPRWFPKLYQASSYDREMQYMGALVQWEQKNSVQVQAMNLRLSSVFVLGKFITLLESEFSCSSRYLISFQITVTYMVFLEVLYLLPSTYKNKICPFNQTWDW